ncbi:MAG: sel1 repeat family protein [Chloroflexia bacterium]|nr:sel1 repeat family protein [Chloroflexia bacterium]
MGQSKEYPLYTAVDTADIAKYRERLSFLGFSMENLLEYRNFARTYAYSNDPLGEYIYASTFDLYPFGLGDAISADTAMVYYKRAADKNLALAEEFLFTAYKYGLMTIEEDSKTALEYLERLMLHGDSSYKANAYRQVALLYYNGNFKEIKVDTIKTKENLELSLKYDSTDTWTIDFLGGIYEDEADYEKAIELLLKSGNSQSHLKVAEWLVDGEKVKKDFERGLSIILSEAEKLINSDINVYQYMAARNPVFMLNDLYQSKQITRDQLGEFYLENYFKD